MNCSNEPARRPARRRFASWLAGCLGVPAAVGLMLLLPVAEPLKYGIWAWLVLSLPHRGHLEEIAVPALSMGRGATRLCWPYTSPDLQR